MDAGLSADSLSDRRGPPRSRTNCSRGTAIVTRDVTAIEQLPGGFSALYPVLRRLEETGRIRRGYFVAGLGAAQFAQPGAVDLLRDARDERDDIPTAVTISADRSGQSLWRADAVAVLATEEGRGATRTAGARVVMVDGRARRVDRAGRSAVDGRAAS